MKALAINAFSAQIKFLRRRFARIMESFWLCGGSWRVQSMHVRSLTAIGQNLGIHARRPRGNNGRAVQTSCKHYSITCRHSRSRSSFLHNESRCVHGPDSRVCDWEDSVLKLRLILLNRGHGGNLSGLFRVSFTIALFLAVGLASTTQS